MYGTPLESSVAETTEIVCYFRAPCHFTSHRHGRVFNGNQATFSSGSESHPIWRKG